MEDTQYTALAADYSAEFIILTTVKSFTRCNTAKNWVGRGFVGEKNYLK